MKSKEELRETLLTERESLSTERVSAFSRAIATIFFSEQLWKDSSIIALYSSIGKEVSTDVLLRQAWQERKSVVLPSMAMTEEGAKLDFLVCRGWGDLVPGMFGILEPDPNRCAPLPEDKAPELMIIPSVGISPQGVRLGYGKGFYDSFFAQTKWKESKRVSPIYSLQLAEFPAEDHDVSMHAYVTEEGIVWV